VTAGGENGLGNLGRAAAVTGGLCVAVHVVAAAVAGHGGAVERAVFVAMAAACLPCIRALWRHPVVGVWRSTAAMYGGMLFVHLLLLTAAPGSSGHAGHGGDAGPPAGGWTWAEAGMWAGLALAGLQVALAGTVLATGRVAGQQRDAVGLSPTGR
jgi:hypothetical protein